MVPFHLRLPPSLTKYWKGEIPENVYSYSYVRMARTSRIPRGPAGMGYFTDFLNMWRARIFKFGGETGTSRNLWPR